MEAVKGSKVTLCMGTVKEDNIVKEAIRRSV